MCREGGPELRSAAILEVTFRQLVNLVFTYLRLHGLQYSTSHKLS